MWMCGDESYPTEVVGNNNCVHTDLKSFSHKWMMQLEVERFNVKEKKKCI